jgi:hypothetical protein
MDMIKMISKAAGNNYLVAFFNALQKEDDKLNINVKELEKYAIPIIFNEQTIPAWEKWLELSEPLNWSIEDRRDRIIYTINSNQSCTKQFLKDQIKSILNEEVDILEDFPNYHFIIKFRKMLSGEHNLESFKEMLNVNKPAHLTYDIKLRYRIWRELKPKKWRDLKKYTWKEIIEKEEI